MGSSHFHGIHIEKYILKTIYLFSCLRFPSIKERDFRLRLFRLLLKSTIK